MTSPTINRDEYDPADGITPPHPCADCGETEFHGADGDRDVPEMTRKYGDVWLCNTCAEMWSDDLGRHRSTDTMTHARNERYSDITRCGSDAEGREVIDDPSGITCRDCLMTLLDLAYGGES